jgi:hypothetical protein
MRIARIGWRPNGRSNSLSNDLNNLAWHPLGGLSGNFAANLAALKPRYPELASRLASMKPACEYYVAADGNRIILARRVGDVVNVLPNPVPAEMARTLAQKIYPGNVCTAPAMIAGLDQGWLWHALYEVSCSLPGLPGHRPPLYLLAGDIERLWVVLHVQQWQKLLADSRSLLFVGADAVAQAQRSMREQMAVPWPKFCLTIDPQLWAPGMNLEALIADATTHASARLQQARAAQAAAAATGTGETLPSPLRVLGITSRYTTFLQHSMRDWLSAFQQLGHETKLLIESADHEIFNTVVYAEACAEFRPDLIVIIDHYRNEIDGLPSDVPCVMWVQDNLPNIFSAKAGAAQGRRDYCLGFGRLTLSRDYGYPHDRYMPAQVGVNAVRFAPRALSESERREYACDVSFVSHASAPAEQLLAEECQKQDAPVRRLLGAVFEELRGIYDSGGSVTQPLIIRRMIERSLPSLGLAMGEPALRATVDFFTQKINNALFRHQSLQWLAEMDLDIRLYGQGWENHPRLKRFARGVADNQGQLCTIYQASRINLQITPFGAVHQRLFEGVASGGFFLLRHTSGDEIELHYRLLHEACRRMGINSDDQLLQRAPGDPHVQRLLDELTRLIGFTPAEAGQRITDVLALSADGEYTRSAATVWEQEYPQVAFRSREELHDRVKLFLADEPRRHDLAGAMRKTVVERFTYTAITRRLIDFIARDLARGSALLAA